MHVGMEAWMLCLSDQSWSECWRNRNIAPRNVSLRYQCSWSRQYGRLIDIDVDPKHPSIVLYGTMARCTALPLDAGADPNVHNDEDSAFEDRDHSSRLYRALEKSIYNPLFDGSTEHLLQHMIRGSSRQSTRILNHTIGWSATRTRSQSQRQANCSYGHQRELEARPTVSTINSGLIGGIQQSVAVFDGWCKLHLGAESHSTVRAKKLSSSVCISYKTPLASRSDYSKLAPLDYVGPAKLAGSTVSYL